MLKQAQPVTLWRASAIMLFGALVVNGGNYLFALITARFLGPSAYGTFAAILSIVVISGIFGSAGNILAMRSVAQFAPDGWASAWHTRQAFFAVMRWIFLGTAVVVLAISPFLIHKLSLSPVHIVFIIILTLLAIALSIERGFIQGMQQYSRVTINMASEVVLKLGGVLLLALLLHTSGFIGSNKVEAILIFFGLGMSMAWFYVWKPAWKKTQAATEVVATPSYSYIWNTVVSLAALAVLMNGDVITAKASLSAEATGQMAALAKMAQVIFFSTSPIVGAVFPLISNNFDRGSKHVHLLVKALVLSITISVGILGVFVLFPNTVVKVLFGSSYIGASPLLAKMGIAMVVFTIGNLYVNYFLCLKERWYSLMLIGIAVVHIVLLKQFNSDLAHIVTVDLFSFSLLSASGVLWYIVTKRRQITQLLRFEEGMWRLLLRGAE